MLCLRLGKASVPAACRAGRILSLDPALLPCHRWLLAPRHLRSRIGRTLATTSASICFSCALAPCSWLAQWPASWCCRCRCRSSCQGAPAQPPNQSACFLTSSHLCSSLLPRCGGRRGRRQLTHSCAARRHCSCAAEQQQRLPEAPPRQPGGPSAGGGAGDCGQPGPVPPPGVAGPAERVPRQVISHGMSHGVSHFAGDESCALW